MGDTSPENLRKFLESDDPALVRMGLSMAKGAGVPEELLSTILRFYMWDDDKSVRNAARTLFFKHATDELKEKVKENWKSSYRTLSITGDKFPEAVRPLLEAFKSQDNFALIVLEPLINMLGDKNKHSSYVRQSAAQVLGKIGDKRAVEPLIKVLEDEKEYVRSSAAWALGNIGDKRAVEPLIKSCEHEQATNPTRISPYGKLPPSQHVISILSALGNIGDKRAVKLIVKAHKDEDVRKYAANALGTLLSLSSVEEGSNHNRSDYVSVNLAAEEARPRGGMTKDNSPENLRKFLENDDPAMVLMGLSMAKGSGVPEELLPTILGLYMWDDDKTVRDSAKLLFFKYAPEEIQSKVKGNWIPSYRLLISPRPSSYKDIQNVTNILSMIGIEGLRTLLNNVGILPRLASGDGQDRLWCKNLKISIMLQLMTLGWVPESDEQKATYLIGVEDWQSLFELGEPAVEPLIKELLDEVSFSRHTNIANVLGWIGDNRAVEPLIKVFEGENTYYPDIPESDTKNLRQSAKEALKKLGHEVE